ncbi:MAG: deoxyribose-phosphate aldolase [Synergistaceae bacterium]|nr:deoxyribose-phosphate aldolase [Candidatus Equadaptatus faecalis]
MELAGIIDHTNLQPDASESDIRQLCAEARQYRFASVCVNPCSVRLAAKELEGSGVEVCAVCGFPLGANTTETKVFEAERAFKDGASEIDMVINVGKLKEGNDGYVLNEIKAVVEAVPQAVVKVIIETCLLSREEKIRACRLVKQSGAAYAKTSTGFSKSGATAEDVKLMRETLGEGFGIKAAGGIRSRSFAEELVRAGADRIGASKSVEICKR